MQAAIILYCNMSYVSKSKVDLIVKGRIPSFITSAHIGVGLGILGCKKDSYSKKELKIGVYVK